MAIEFAWRSHDSKEFPGGCYFISAETAAPETALADLAPALGVRATDNVPQTAAIVRAAMEALGEPSLLVVDNVRDADSWAEWQQHLPGPLCRRLITTRAPMLPRVTMKRLDRLPTPECVDLLANFRADAKDPASRPAAESVAEWLDGWAVAVALVGAYMYINREAAWTGYWDDLQKRGLRSLRDVGHQPEHRGIEYQRTVDALLGDILANLNAAERRVIDYAAFLPEDQVPESWLRALLERDGTKLPVKPGVTDAFAAVLERLSKLDLLRPRQQEGSLYALHRVLRRHIQEVLSAGD